MAKARKDGTVMLPCPKCCPAYVREFDGRRFPAGKCSHELDYEEIDAKLVRGWRCWNCGNFKKPRQITKRRDFDYVTNEAISDENMNKENRVKFHYFNPNGLLAQLKSVQERVDAFVDSTGIPNGAKMVHGSWNFYHSDALRKLMKKDYRVGQIELNVCLTMVRRAVQEAEEFMISKQKELDAQ